MSKTNSLKARRSRQRKAAQKSNAMSGFKGMRSSPVDGMSKAQRDVANGTYGAASTVRKIDVKQWKEI